MRNESNRLGTFVGWPVAHISPSEMASNGFYYLGRNDEARCFSCKIEIMNWREEETPASMHLRYAPQCRLHRGYDECGTGDTTPAHPEFATERARLASFTGWSPSMAQRPEQMANAGFFYTGRGDCVKCFFCDGECRSWETHDDPWEQHALHFGRCEFVKTVKGAGFVGYVGAKFHNAPAETPADTGLGTCAICIEKPRNVALVPCGHIVSCAECSFGFTTCPICRVVVRFRQRVFLS